MQMPITRKAVDSDTRRNIMQAARARKLGDIARKSQVDFVAEEVCKVYKMSLMQLRGTELGKDIDRLGEILRQEMLQRSLKVALA